MKYETDADSIRAKSEPLEPRAGEFYIEDGLLVFTAAYHLRRGYCCQSECRHCPFRGEAS